MIFIFYLSSRPADFFPVINEAESYAAHFILYFILAVLFVFALESWQKISRREILIYSFLGSIIYAGLDEFHQSYILTRSASFSDFFIDGLGSLVSLLFFYKLIKPKLLLHICCIGCGAYISQELKKEFKITLFFYNPNIYPRDEYEKRLIEVKKTAGTLGLKIIFGNYDHNSWLAGLRGFERNEEGEERCLLCYRDRLARTAREAEKNGFNFFGTTLSISPHKDSMAINKIGRELKKEYGINFLDRDFKKQDGFKKSSALSRELGLYRQNYCGCEFSLRPSRRLER
jgi:predicted adenine nucleotide alpha hydrolase (AANH) superfamily ATPase/VanZ family protein